MAQDFYTNALARTPAPGLWPEIQGLEISRHRFDAARFAKVAIIPSPALCQLPLIEASRHIVQNGAPYRKWRPPRFLVCLVAKVGVTSFRGCRSAIEKKRASSSVE